MMSDSSVPVPAMPLPPLEDLIACPHCDLLHRDVDPGPNERVRCRRCHHVMFATRPQAFLETALLSVASAILMISAIFFPFLGIDAAGQSHDSSVFQTALAFSTGWLLPLSAAVLLLIVLLPLLRVFALIYVLAPLIRGRPAFRGAARAMRMAEAVRPWSMVEVFVVGTIVALIKVSALAQVGLGPAFWALVALVVVVTIKDYLISNWTIWKAIAP
jgi:paraquat-inducible protein A